MSSAISTHDVSVDLACFEVAGQVYGIDVLHIREIVRSQDSTALPKAPELIEGVVDLRGVVVPVVDLAQALGCGTARSGGEARIVVIEMDELVFGLRVDAAVDVISPAADTVVEPPALVTHSGYDAVRAVVRRQDQPPVLVLSLEHILESVYRSGPSGVDEDAHAKARTSVEATR